MIQISEDIFLDEYIYSLDIKTKYLPNPYKKTPYLIIKDFFKPHELALFVNEIRNGSKAEVAKVKTELIPGVVDSKVVKKYRDTKIYSLEKHLDDLYRSRFEEYQKQIEDYFSLAITISTEVQALEYQKGGFYIQHSDDSNALVDKEQNIIGYTAIAAQRKLTTVLFGTSYSDTVKDKYSFNGGELVFNFLKDKDENTVVLQPIAGDMVVFPSNPYFSHEVKKVLSGYRLTLVQWHNAILV